LVGEEPVAEVDGEVDLIGLCNLEDSFALLHVNRNEFIADFWSVLRGVHKAELLRAHLLGNVRLNLEVELLTFDALLPADLVETLAEVNYEGYYCLVKLRIQLLADSV
jgi:hypothetical protein